MLAIHIENVSKGFGVAKGLDRLTLDVQQGSVFGLLGPNGAGKTTTLRILLGLVLPDSGSVTVLGRDPAVDARAVRRATGALLENDGLYERLSAEENLEYYGRIYQIPQAVRRQRIGEILTAFGLAERRREPVRWWSRGMRQKLAIGRALLHRPPLLLLDEPFAGLDPLAAVELREALASLAASDGTTVLLTSHDLAHVEKVCALVAVIRAGHVLAAGAPAELIRKSTNLEVDVTGVGLSNAVLAAMLAERIIVSYSLDGAVARVTCTSEARPSLTTELVRRGVSVNEAHTRRNSLEETFLALIRPVEAEE